MNSNYAPIGGAAIPPPSMSSSPSAAPSLASTLRLRRWTLASIALTVLGLMGIAAVSTRSPSISSSNVSSAMSDMVPSRARIMSMSRAMPRTASPSENTMDFSASAPASYMSPHARMAMMRAEMRARRAAAAAAQPPMTSSMVDRVPSRAMMAQQPVIAPYVKADPRMARASTPRMATRIGMSACSNMCGSCGLNQACVVDCAVNHCGFSARVLNSCMQYGQGEFANCMMQEYGM